MTLKKLLRPLLLLLSFISTLAYAADNLDKIAAVVNDQIITQTELTQAISAVNAEAASTGKTLSPADAQKKALDNLIDRDLQLQIAKANKITVSDDELNTALNQVAAEHHITLAQLPDALKQQGLTLDTFKAQLKEQLLIEDFQRQELTPNINITPQEIKTEVQKLKSHPETQVLYHFEDIVIPLPANPTPESIANAKQTFESIAKAIDQKEDFDKISQENTHKAPEDLGWRAADQLPPELGKLLPNLKEGQIAPPVRSPNGIHILKLIQTKTLTAANNLDNTITETHVRHILLKKDSLTPDATLERRLLSIRDTLVHGGDFAKTAEENSQDPGSVSAGGDLGWVKPGVLDPKFETAMNKLKVNEISQPIKTQFGWHLIQVLGRKQTEDPAAALQEKAEQILFQEKMDQAVQQLISQLRAQAFIKIYAK